MKKYRLVKRIVHKFDKDVYYYQLQGLEGVFKKKYVDLYSSFDSDYYRYNNLKEALHIRDILNKDITEVEEFIIPDK